MKISDKILLLILFFLIALGSSTFVGLTQLSKIENELSNVANRDIVLTQFITAISHSQFEKAILFERIVRIAEELGYEDVSVARKEHLLDYIVFIQTGFNKLTQASGMKIIKGKAMVEEGVKEATSLTYKKELEQVAVFFLKLEQAHIQYDALVKRMVDMISTGDYKLDLDDLDKTQSQERRLNNQFKEINIKVQNFTRKSVQRAELEERKASQILWFSLLISTIAGVVIAVLIISSIVRPLKSLEHAAHKISKGEFVSNLDERSKDEIGHVSRAFNLMSKRLKEAQSELEQKNEDLAESLEITESQKSDLEKVNKELDSFVYTVSHDIRSPLMGIMGYASILENQYYEQFDKRGQRCVTGIRNGVNRLNTMINDLLALTRISRINNPYEQVDMGALVQSILDRLEYKIAELNVELDVHKEMPTIICDRIKIGEVFLNLINNGIKFSSKNENEPPKIKISYKEQDDMYEFFVKDNGIGIAEENHAEVFGIFKRLETAREFEGTGTGLCIVKGVIEDHGGKIWIESKLGHGAEFHFSIPKNLKIKQEA